MIFTHLCRVVAVLGVIFGPMMLVQGYFLSNSIINPSTSGGLKGYPRMGRICFSAESFGHLFVLTKSG